MEIFKLWEKTPGEFVYEPEIAFYPALQKATDATVVIFPGGAYARLAPHEGEGSAQFFNTLGMNAFVVKNRVSPCRFPLPLLDARRAVRFVRANAEKFGIDKDRVAVMGSSAGGHLSALVSTYRGKIDFEGADEIDSEDYLPNGQILCYPVICMSDERVAHMGSNINLLGEERWRELAPSVDPSLIADEKTPEAFFWHTSDDSAVNVMNTYRYAMRLRELNIPVQVAVYPKGYHGQGLAPAFRLNRNWRIELEGWLRYKGFLDKDLY